MGCCAHAGQTPERGVRRLRRRRQLVGAALRSPSKRIRTAAVCPLCCPGAGREKPARASAPALVPHSATCSGRRPTWRLPATFRCFCWQVACCRADTGCSSGSWCRGPAPAGSGGRDRNCRRGMRAQQQRPAAWGPTNVLDAEPCVCNTRRPPVCGCCRHSENPVVTSADTAGPPAASERPKTRALPDGASPRACTAAHAQGAASNGHASRHPSLPTLQLGSSGAVTAAANGAACCRASGAWRLVRGIPLRSLATCGSPAGQQPCKLQQLAAAAAAAPAQLGTTRCCC